MTTAPARHDRLAGTAQLNAAELGWDAYAGTIAVAHWSEQPPHIAPMARHCSAR